MNFQVPQFIEIEDKIFGPLTFKQFVYLGGGAGLSFIVWVYVPFRPLAIILIAPIALLALALAFYKVNNRPFLFVLESAFKYLFSKKLYLWKKTPPAAKTVVTPPSGTNNRAGGGIMIPRLSQSRLKEFSWSLDVQEHIKK